MNRYWAWVAFIGLVFLLQFWLMARDPGQPPVPTVPYSDFKSLLEQGQVSAVVMQGEELRAELASPRDLGLAAPSERLATRLPPIDDPDLYDQFKRHGVKMTAKAPPGDSWLASWLPWLILIAIYLFFWMRVSRNMPGGFGGGDRFKDFLQGRATKEDTSAKQVTFDDVAGQENAKLEVAEIVDFLRNPAKYTEIGAEPPRGVLLMGPPGTGKTLMARALAGEAGVPFFNISASEFIEMFVGVGASRVRSMFEEAKKRAPAILFIDELDAVGRVRGAGFGGGHDEREQTLNQILSEMDGFEGHEAVVVLAATNRPDVLDPALLRPGRFDRHVTLDLPDRSAREAILRVHVRKKPLDEDVDLDLVAAATPGFSGADLKNLVNEAAIAAVREGSDVICMHHFDTMRDRVIMGMERKLTIGPAEKHRLAVHEAGHTAVAHYLENTDALYKVTIIPRGRALGGTHMLPEAERYIQSADELHDQLAVMLGGRAAERAFLGSGSSGADDDIKRATGLARAMVSRWGMSERIGPADFRQSDAHPFLGREIAQPHEFSDATAHEVDQEVRAFLSRAEERATKVIEDQRPAIERLITRLEEQETLDRIEIDKCLGAERGGRKQSPPPPAAA